MLSVCSFRYMLANSFCAFLSFRALILVGFLLLHLEAVFMSARFFLTASVSHWTLGFALCLVGMHSAAAASKWVLTKFSYSSFGVCVSDFYWKQTRCRLSYNWSLWRCFVLLFEEIPFLFEISLSWLCLGFLAWDFVCLSLEISIHLFFFPFPCLSYCCSICTYVASDVIGYYN